MSFKKFEEHLPHRFREFDEARKYIENMLLDTKLTQEAIDYMISRREYHFILKNLISQFYQEGGSKQLFDYLFSKFTECPKRVSDLEIYIKILDSPNETLKKSFLGYLKSCASQLYPFILKLLKDKNPEKRRIAVCLLKYIPDEEIKKEIIEHLPNEKNKTVLEEILKYFEIYLAKEEIKCLNFIKKQYPDLEQKVNQILQNL